MLIVFRIGRAGNQMFQFAGIASAKKPGEKILFVNFSHLIDVLPSITREGWFITPPRLIRSRLNQIDALLKIFAKIRLIGGVFESETRTKLIRRPGLLPVTVFWGGTCQDEKLIDVEAVLQLFDPPKTSVSRCMSKKQESPAGRTARTCFVHVRRGDYLDFPSTEHPAALPATWFFEQMDAIRLKHSDTRFLVCSDDAEFAENTFGAFKNTRVVNLPVRETFELMSAADDGILSPSTFSWWAARIAWNRGQGTFIAPYLWAGWRFGEWYPHKNIASSFLTYVEVDPSV